MLREQQTANGKSNPLAGMLGMPKPAKYLITGNPLPVDQIIHGDCINIMAGFPAGSVDLVVTDPPYLVNYRDRHGRSIKNDVQDGWLKPAFSEIYRVLKDNSFCVSFYGDIHVDKFMAAWRAAGFRPVGHIVWPKRYASSSWYLSRHHEQAFLLAKGRPPRPERPLPDIQEWQYTGNRLHPTQKAVEVIKPLIECFSGKGDLVLDPFAGSGTTALAAKERGRSYIGIDLEIGYVQKARNRLSEGNSVYGRMFGH